MALPAGTTKATGLAAALDDLHVSAAATIGVGDAENDHAFMQLCGAAVAVGNALPAVQSSADVVMPASNGAGVRMLIEKILADAPLMRAQRRVPLGPIG
jgi:hydroxymethylpyrimidine pyrophosphatase-like HAD family hydrolase